MSRVEGEAAKNYRAVRLDSFEDANKGELVLADDVTGEVEYKDATGTVVKLALGPSAMRIMRK